MKEVFWRDGMLRAAFLLSLGVHCAALSIAGNGRPAAVPPGAGDALTVRMGSTTGLCPVDGSNAPIEPGSAAAGSAGGAPRREHRERAEEGRTRRQPRPPRGRPVEAPGGEPKREAAGEAARASIPSAGASGRSERDSAGERGYLALVRERIERAKRYPAEARLEGAEGSAVVRFRLARDGNVTGVRLVRSSFSKVLDWEAEATVRRAAPFPRIPDETGREFWEIRIPISFEMAARKGRRKADP
ncbi:MAG: energy transducer TonB [bacterium]|nr:energy transducer TonB [bacterium]